MENSSVIRPLASFVVLAYNQEHLVREAVEGAFRQTYCPLEIILSDDCSSDRTFDIMQELALSYSGPHKVVLNRNHNNLGIGGHINRVMDIAKGEWIVVSAGDDVSMPERTAETVIWTQKHKMAFSVYGDLDYICDGRNDHYRFYPDIDSHELLSMVRKGGAKVAGASHAWHRRVFEVFGPLAQDVVSEDRAIPFRSALLGEIVWVPRKWVRFRIHGSSISTTGQNALGLLEYNNHRLKPYQWMRATFSSFKSDLNTALAKNLISQERFNELATEINFQSRQLERYMLSWSGNYWQRLRSSAQIIANPSHFTGDSFKQRAAILCNALFPVLDPLYHRLIRTRRFRKPL